MGMDFSTQDRLDEVDVFQLDDLVRPDFEVATGSPEVKQESVFTLIAYWIGELRWRMKYWDRTRK